MNQKRIMRSKSDRMLLGVAGGLAHYLNIDPVFVRLFFVVTGLVSFGHVALLYLLLALLIPDEQPAATVNPFNDEEIIIKDAVSG